MKSSLEKLRTFREDSQHEIHNSRKKQNDSQEERNALQKKRNNSRKKRHDTREEREDSREHIEQKEIRILKELAVFSKKEYTESSQQKNVRKNDLNFASQKQTHFSQNFEFVQENSRRTYNASETTYRVAYISK